MADEPFVEPQSPEDPLRAQAVEAAQLARTLAEKVQYAEGSEWLNNIEPEAKAYFDASQQAEKALLLSIAISVMRLAGGMPAAIADAEESRSADFALEPMGRQRVRSEMAHDDAREGSKGHSNKSRKASGGKPASGRGSRTSKRK